MLIDVARRLTHRVSRSSILAQTDTAELQYNTAVPGVACFIEPRTRRFLSRGGVQVPVDFTVLFLPSQALVVGDKLTSGVMLDGSTVLTRGIVVYLDGVEHPLDGLKLQIAYASDLAGEVEAPPVGGAVYTWVQTAPMWASTTPLWIDYAGTP